MSDWFSGDSEIDSTIQQVKVAFEDLGGHYAAVVALMPGLTSVELVEQGSDSVTIRTNEGLMKRTNIGRRIENDGLVVEFDEEYQAGSKLTVTSHFLEEFVPSATGVTLRLVVRDVEAPGFLGFFYKRFGGSKMGNALLAAHKAFFEQATG